MDRLKRRCCRSRRHRYKAGRSRLHPNFVGAELNSALAVLTDNDMNYLVIQVYSDDVAKDLVISQSPGAGNDVDENSAVYIVASLGPAALASP